MTSDKKIVLVTGVSRGLGLVISKELLGSGYFVIGVSRTRSEQVNQLLSDHSNRYFYEQFDLEKVEQISSFVSELHKKYGRFYGLVNNAGIGLDGVLATMHEKDVFRLINLNLVAPLLLCKYISRGMLANRSGRIVNISSIVAITGFNGLSVYGASKAGLHGLTKSLSRELGKASITVNTVSPGYMQTEMTEKLSEISLESVRRRSPFQRFVTPEEVANVVTFLLSDAGGSIHGTNTIVDLGSTA